MNRVLVFSGDPGIPLYGPSGSSAHLRGIARAWQDRGAQVHIAVPRLWDQRGAVADPLEVSVTSVPPQKWRGFGRLRERGEWWDGRRLARTVLRELAHPPDVIWERYSLVCDGGIWLKKRVGGLHLIEVNAPLSMERQRFGRVRDRRYVRRSERAVLRAADRVITPSAWLAEWAVEEIGCEQARVRHVPNGTSATRVGDRATTRVRLGLTGVVIGFVGSMKSWHGIERIPSLLERMPGATALMVGAGPGEGVTHPRMVHLGRVEPAALPDVIAAMDVGLAPYRSDAPPWFCPLKILDYRAQGVPVVAADLGDCRELLADGGGEVVASDDVTAWVSAIARVATRPRSRWVRSWEDVVAEALAE